jgi:hypothetical protein
MDWLLGCASPAASFAYSLIFPAHRENSDCTGTYDGSTPVAVSFERLATSKILPDWQVFTPWLLGCLAAQATIQAYLRYGSSAVKKCKTFVVDCWLAARRSRLHWLSAGC